MRARPTFYGAAATPRTAPFGTVDHPLPLIIDSDPGLDDALAIGLAVARPELDLLAVTTVGGNADVTPLHRERPAPAPRLRPGRRPGRRGRGGRAAGLGRAGDRGPRRERDRRHEARAARRRPCIPATRSTLIARLLRRPPGARRDRADRAADQHRPAAAAPPGPRPEDRPPVPDGRLDRGGEHHRLRRVQHLRRPRGRRRRVPVRRADHDDGPRRHPPGAARPVARAGAAATRAPGRAGSPRSSRTSRSTATCSGRARR